MSSPAPSRLQQRGKRGLQDHEQCSSPRSPGQLAAARSPAPARHRERRPGRRGASSPPRGAGRSVGRLSSLAAARPAPRASSRAARGEAVRVVHVAEQLALPQRVVGVLHGQRRPLRRPAGAAGGVGGGQVAQQRRERPAVAGDVVQHEHQDVLARAQRATARAQRRARRPGRTGRGGRGQQRRQLASAAPRRPPAPGAPPPGRARSGAGSPSASGEHGAQASRAGATTSASAARSAPRRAARSAAARPGCCRSALGPVQLVQEPQPVLREGQRACSLRSRSPARSCGRGRRRRSAEPGGERGHGRRVEHVADGELDAEHGADAADQPGGEQRVPAEGEEVVVDADRGHAEHLGEQPAQQSPRGGCAARPAGGARRRPARAARPGRACRWGSAAARRGPRTRPAPCSRAAAGGARTGGRARRRSPAAGRPRRRRAAGRRRRSSADDDDGLGDRRVRGQHRLDLAELDPEAADLHLVVGAAHELELPSAGPARPGRRCGTSASPGGPNGSAHEPLGGQPRPAVVAAGQAGPAEVQLADGTRAAPGAGARRARTGRVFPSSGRPIGATPARARRRSLPWTAKMVVSVGP